jgi:UDP-N-acetyl-D-glucosamine dehydrogenase
VSELKTNNTVTVIGQGFVGIPMAVLIADKTNFIVRGIDRNNKNGRFIKKKINNGQLPFNTQDKIFLSKFKKVYKLKKYRVSLNLSEIDKSVAIVVSVNFDFIKKNSISNLRKLFFEISKKIKKGTLIILETTLPPGTCDNIILPVLRKNLIKRKMQLEDIFFSYSYERVTPGKNYYNSIANNFRVYSGMNEQSELKCKNFLSRIINTKKYKLTKLDKLSDCETCKIFENTYRAINIALVDEWTRFSIKNRIDIKSILSAIRIRKTHNNIMNPGLGVGGYCLTKDPKFLDYTAKKILKCKTNFPITNRSLIINSKMTNVSIEYIKKKIGSFKDKKFLVVGASYKEDVEDLRLSPSLVLINKLLKLAKSVNVYDPLIIQKTSISRILVKKLEFQKYDVVLFCVGHEQVKKINLKRLNKKTIYFDLNNIFTNIDYNFFIRKKINFHELSRPL